MQLRPFLCLLLSLCSLWGGEVFERAAAAAYLASLTWAAKSIVGDFSGGISGTTDGS